MHLQKLLLNLFLFIATFLIAITLRKKELIVAILIAIILILLLILNKFNLKKSIIIILFGFIMALAEFTCIKWFQMWKYNHIAGLIPYYLPFGWSITDIFLLKLLKIGKSI